MTSRNTFEPSPNANPPPPNKAPGRRKPNGAPLDDELAPHYDEPAKPIVGTTLDRAESLPHETQPAPEPTLSQDAVALDDLLATAIAPDDEDVDLSEAELGPPRYTTVPRRTSPPRMIPIRVFSKTVGSVTVYMLSVAREAQDDGDQDTYLLGQSVRIQLAGHPAFQKHIRRYQIRLGVTSLGRPFFLEVNLDDQGVWGQSRRDLVARAETEWVMVSSDRSTGYVYYPADHFDDPTLPEQGFAELYQLTYRSSLIGSLDHPIIKRGALRKNIRP